MRENDEKKERVNPAARKDAKGEPHDDQARSDREGRDEPPRSYQDAELDPRDHGGIAE